MKQRKFMDRLLELQRLDRIDLEAAGVIEPGDVGAWTDFSRDRLGWLLRTTDGRRGLTWGLIERRRQRFDATVATGPRCRTPPPMPKK